MKFKFLTSFVFTSVFTISTAQAGIIFQDNFDDNNTDGWSFIGINNGWNANTGALQSSNEQASHAGIPGLALIDGIVTPDNFKLEADIKVIDYDNLTFGHVGFAWGISGIDTFNTSYLRTHADHFTNWRAPFEISGASELATPLNFDAKNGVSYHFSVEVDFTLQEMTMTLDGVTGVISGAEFQRYGPYQGGQIGLTMWGEQVEYDNVVLSSTSTANVPEPSTLAIFALGIVGLASRQFKKKY
jgi:hypothetical protein